MKVLFAVSNEEISEAIVKRYQKEYKEIISYKNVYYFNAILKEIQKDKSYDRIVISEELEAFTNTQYDQIDKFIFDKLDSISDEASNVRGDDTPIVLICSDRRNKGEEMLVKLFGIGIYDALIGNDRSVEEVCKLINKPRSKKEAKTYYKVEADEVKYQSENENDVSEQEIENILEHYRKLGRNEDRYVTSFDNIVAQYNDAQLRIISKFLPLNVRAVLEERSPKYQQIMAFNSAVTDNIRKQNNKEQDFGPSEKLLKSQKQSTILTGPVVIPSAVNTTNVRKLARTHTVDTNDYQNYDDEEEETIIEQNDGYYDNNTVVNDNNQMNNLDNSFMQTSQNDFNNVQSDEVYVNNDNEQQYNDNEQDSGLKPSQVNQDLEDMFINNVPPKRRGRPKKIITEEEQERIAQEPPKRRGRPRKNPVLLEQIEDMGNDSLSELGEMSNSDNDSTMPGFEDMASSENNAAMPGFEDMASSENDSALPGFEDMTSSENNSTMPGFEDMTSSENDSALPGFEDIASSENNSALPGFENMASSGNDSGISGNQSNNTSENGSIFSDELYNSNNGNNYQKQYIDESDDYDEVTEIINTADNSTVNSILPGFENINNSEMFLNANDSDILPGFENIMINNTERVVQKAHKKEMNPNYSQTSNMNGTALPGFDFSNSQANQYGNAQSNQYTNVQVPQVENQYGNNQQEITPNKSESNQVNQYEEENNQEEEDRLSSYNNNKEFIKPFSYNPDSQQIESDNNFAGANQNMYVPQAPGVNVNMNSQPQMANNMQNNGNNAYQNNIQANNRPSMPSVDISSLLTGDKKIATFVGTSKNGTSFILNNIAEYASSMGINVAILDTTKNKNSYYIYTKNEEELRQVAASCLDNLVNGRANGISVNRNLTVYTSLPEDRENLYNVGQVLETLVRMHNLILIDCDFDTPFEYFSNAQDIYLIQSLDILTIQPLTAFLRELKAHNFLDENKLKIILNKFVKVRGISEKTIIGGMSKYNDPAMSFMTDLFNISAVKYITIPFEQEIYARYLESVINCDISIKGYSKTFMQILKELTNGIYPMASGGGMYKPPAPTTNYNAFSPSMNSTLNQMKNKY